MPDENGPKLRDVDINDLSLSDEQVEISDKGDAFAGPPPPDDGDHRVKIKQNGKVQLGEDKQGRPYYMVNVEGHVVDPGGATDGRVAFDRVSTMILQSAGTSRMATAMKKALGENVAGRMGIRELTQRFVDKLAGEPEVIWTTRWRAYCSDCGKAMKTGQKSFPQVNGSYRHQLECPKCGSLLSAQAQVVDWKPAA